MTVLVEEIVVLLPVDLPLLFFLQTIFTVHRFQTGVVHRIVHSLFVGELHLRLGGVYVHVYAAEGDLHIQHAVGEAARQQTVAVCHFQPLLNERRFDRSAVDEEILGGTVAAPLCRRRHKASDADELIHGITFDHGLGHVSAQQVIHTGLDLAVTGGEKFLLAVLDAADGDIGAAQSALHGGLHAGGALGAVALQELQTGGGIEKQVTNNHGRALGAARFIHFLNIPRSKGHADAMPRSCFTGGHFDAGHRRHRSQRFTAEPEGADAFQTPLILQLTGGMAQEGNARILGAHALAVIGDADIGGTAVADLHGNGTGTCVKGVFHQLLDHRRGSVHHLTRGDQVSHMGGQYIDFGHSKYLR